MLSIVRRDLVSLTVVVHHRRLWPISLFDVIRRPELRHLYDVLFIRS